MAGNLGIEGCAQQRQQLPANAIAGVRQIPGAGVFTPGLRQAEKPGLQGFVAIFEEGPQDAAGLNCKHRVDAAQALGPGSTQELVQHGLRLVVQSMRGGDRVHLAIHNQLPEERISKITGGFLQGFVERWRRRLGASVLMKVGTAGRGLLPERGNETVASSSAASRDAVSGREPPKTTMPSFGRSS